MDNTVVVASSVRKRKFISANFIFPHQDQPLGGLVFTIQGENKRGFYGPSYLS